MDNFEEVKKEYLKQLQLSKIDLNALDPRTKFSAEGIVNAAKQKLADLEYKLLSIILNNSTTIYVSPDVNIDVALSEVIKNNTNVTELDFFDLEKKLLKDVFPQDKIKGYAFDSSAVNRLNNSLVDVRLFINALFMPLVEINTNDYKVLKNEEEAFEHICNIMQKQKFYLQLKSLYLAKQINNFILSNLKSDNKKMFFFVKNTKNPLSLEKITGRTVILDDIKEVITDPKELQLIVSNKIKILK